MKIHEKKLPIGTYVPWANLNWERTFEVRLLIFSTYNILVHSAERYLLFHPIDESRLEYALLIFSLNATSLQQVHQLDKQTKVKLQNACNVLGMHCFPMKIRYGPIFWDSFFTSMKILHTETFRSLTTHSCPILQIR